MKLSSGVGSGHKRKECKRIWVVDLSKHNFINKLLEAKLCLKFMLKDKEKKKN